MLQQKKPAAAEPILRESLAILLKKQPEARDTFHTESLLGAALSGRQKYADAEPLWSGAIWGFPSRQRSEAEKPRPTNRAAPHRCARALVQLYDAWGKPDEAAKRRKELEALTPDAVQPVKPKDK